MTATDRSYTYDTEDSLRDDLAATRQELRVMTSLYHAAFGAACDAMIEIERQRRMIAEMREERERMAVRVFGPSQVESD